VDSPVAVAVLPLLWLAALAKLLLARRSGSEAGVRTLCLALLMVAGSITVDLNVVYLRLDRLLGGANVSCLLVYGQAVTAVWAFYKVLDLHLARALAGAPGDVRRGRRQLGIALAAMVLLFVAGPAWLPDRPKLDAHPYTSLGSAAFFVVTVGAGSYFTWRAILGAWRAAGHARATGRTAFEAGLRLLAVAGVLGLGNNDFQLLAFPALPAGTGVTALSDVLTAAGFCAAGLVAAGATAPVAEKWLGRGGVVRQQYAFAALYPLWRDLATVAPATGGDHRKTSWVSGGVAVRDVRYRLYRRVIDIRDGFLKLRPYLAPTAVEAERARGPAVDLTGHKLRADVEAAAVAAAIRASHRGRPAQSQSPGEGGRMPGGANLASETEWLLAVAARYRRHARHRSRPR
jgi:hypothetical protein